MSITIRVTKQFGINKVSKRLVCESCGVARTYNGASRMGVNAQIEKDSWRNTIYHVKSDTWVPNVRYPVDLSERATMPSHHLCNKCYIKWRESNAIRNDMAVDRSGYFNPTMFSEPALINVAIRDERLKVTCKFYDPVQDFTVWLVDISLPSWIVTAPMSDCNDEINVVCTSEDDARKLLANYSENDHASIGRIEWEE